ncbi:MAG: MarR family transcriptional regulator [Sphingomonas fennica]
MESDDFGGRAPRYADFFPPGSRDDLEFRFTRELILVTRWWTTFIEEKIRAATGQSRARWQVLYALVFAGEPPTTLALSDMLGVQWPTLVRTLNGLEEDALIERRANPGDGRSRLIAITPAGRAVVDQVQPVLVPTRARILDGIDDDLLVAMTGALQQIGRRIAAD